VTAKNKRRPRDQAHLPAALPRDAEEMDDQIRRARAAVPGSTRGPCWGARILFSATLFTSALLLFSVQPLLAKLVLPDFGGAPAVWTTCMMFFQAALLVGYAYSDLATRHLPPMAQPFVHGVVMLLPFAVLPIDTAAHRPTGVAGNPVLDLVGLLLLSGGLPFVAVSASAPMLQAWFARTEDVRAQDPYFLYAASNLGSLAGLLAYPVLIEPWLGLRQQCVGWAGGYAVLVFLVWCCAARTWHAMRTALPCPEHVAVAQARGAGNGRPSEKDRDGLQPGADSSIRPGQVLLWLAYALVPSSLLLSITSTLTANVAPMPLLWVLPLAVYLITFVVAFEGYGPRLRTAVRRLCPWALALMAFVFLSESVYRIGHALPVYLGLFFLVALYCHGELACRRPPAFYLTRYYLAVALGGVLGGMFNAVLAPRLFSFEAELPIVLAAGACLLPGAGNGRRLGRVPWLALVAACAVLQAICLFAGSEWGPWLRFGLPVALALPLMGRPYWFAGSLALLLACSVFVKDRDRRTVYRERSFFGVLTVEAGKEGKTRTLVHGTVRHGAQLVHDDPKVRRLPLMYFFPTGPAGQLFEESCRLGRRGPVAVVGLGAGALASYAQPEQEFVFYEIDPAVVRIASDPQLFTYLSESPGTCRTVLGDGRISLQTVSDGHFDLVVVDAFSGDAIPTHLLTVEAMQIYLAKTPPRGVLAFHITNEFVRLAPVIGNLAQEFGLSAFLRDDRELNATEQRLGKRGSTWVVVARNVGDLGKIADDPRWQPIAPDPSCPLWTDDATSLWPVLKL
jgi:hypothetical protein